MNRTLTAGVAFAAALGTAGLALAQGYAPGSNAQSPGMTSTPAVPNTGASPGMTPGAASNGQQGTMQNGQLTSPANIQQAQQQLRSQGLYNGAIDGQLGPEMRTALKQFQQRNGLPQTGALDQQTSARLSQSSNNMSPTPTSGSTMPDTATGGRQMNSPGTTNR
jgi:peptidoglycan hydrolase-like protein with peptidoglycan-binding domain